MASSAAVEPPDSNMITKLIRSQSFSEKRTEAMVSRFLTWLKAYGYLGYDPYDLWATRCGIAARKIFYRNKLLGSILAAPVAAADLLFPSLRNWVSSRKRYPTADAHFILGFLKLDSAMGDKRFLPEAESIADFLISSSIPGFSGCCWGYPFDWQNNRGLWKKGTPFITVTPYAFEALLALYDATQHAPYLDRALSSARFALNDLKSTSREKGAASSSYSPFDETQIVNASSYRAFMLAEAFFRSGEETYLKAAEENAAFILRAQQEEGSWLYALGNPQDAFIDHFHTCFVLKNLYKANRRLKREDIRQALDRGMKYYRAHLFDAQGMPRPYALGKKPGVLKMTLYDAAEAISLGVLMRDDYPDYFEKSVRLALDIEKFQHSSGYFATSVFVWGPQYYPFIRWPQAQLFYALSSLFHELRRRPCAE